jgi:cell division septal protein FtsQ
MREQVVASRGPRASKSQPRGFVQRPARRDSAVPGNSWSVNPRALFAYVPRALKFILALLLLVTLFVGYRVAASASLFQVRSIDVSGTTRASSDEIENLTRRAVAKTGVWRADLNAISAELERLPGVRRAVVSRVLPDRLRIRVTERVPVAVVRTAAGHFFWVDDEGIALGEMKSDDTAPSFFIRGWNEDGTEDARKENAERVQKYVEISHEWSALGLSERVSEVSLIDLRDVRAQLAGKDSEIEVRLGGQDLGDRLRQALDALDQYRQTPGGAAATYIDLQTGRIVIGTNTGNKVSTASTAPATVLNNGAASSTTSNSAKPAASSNSNRTAPTNDQRQKPANTNTRRDDKPANNSRMRLR